MTQEWKIVCRLREVPLTRARVVQRGLAWQELPGVALFRDAAERVYALLDRCPQGGCALSLGCVEDGYVVCPQHGWRVALASGCAVAPDQGRTRTYAVRVEDGRVWLDMAELKAPASRAEAALAGAFAVAPRVATA
ncbi:Rieske 2Fe-2S domain-containing protein [Janthinobacterium sp.]|uniref:Rieske 2Fe-2S domain-containing protein n=1 Tax=Janthinobacterium sp. TaxID=1871054 RepID=UPI00293D662A|nr:Rieske 2Fe-2S domain-containing protein [Janthinobacterium sp.]